MYIPEKRNFLGSFNAVIDGIVKVNDPWLAAQAIRERVKGIETLRYAHEDSIVEYSKYVERLEALGDAVEFETLDRAYDTYEDMLAANHKLEDILDCLEELAEALEKVDEAIGNFEYLTK